VKPDEILEQLGAIPFCTMCRLQASIFVSDMRNKVREAGLEALERRTERTGRELDALQKKNAARQRRRR